MQIICVVGRTEAGKTAKIEPEQMQAEIRHAAKLYSDGVIRQIWSRADAGGAVLLFEVGNVEEARALVADLPLAKAGVLQVDAAYPLIPYRGFAPTT